VAKIKAKTAKVGVRVMVYKGTVDVKTNTGQVAKKADGSNRKHNIWAQYGDLQADRQAAGILADKLPKGTRRHIEGVSIDIVPIPGFTERENKEF
jgi:hypothetical protein